MPLKTKRNSDRPPTKRRGAEEASNPSAAHEPAQGHLDTAPKYRDRPTDDGKYGDAAEEPVRRDDVDRR